MRDLLEWVRERTNAALDQRRIADQISLERVGGSSEQDLPPRQRRLRAVRRFFTLNGLITTVYMLYFLGHFAKFAINVFLIVSSLTPAARLQSKLRDIADRIRIVCISVNLAWMPDLWDLFMR